MRVIDVIGMCNSGMTAITYHTLSASHGYKVYKFRKAIQSLYRECMEKENDFLAEVGIEEPSAFDRRLEELRLKTDKSEEETNEFKEMVEKLNKLNGYRNAMYVEEADLKGILPLPYEEWKKLQDENMEVEFNGGKVDILMGENEELLEGVLWNIPDE